MSGWNPCKRIVFIRRGRKLGFDGPFSGTKMKCTVQDCQGGYEKQLIVHTVRDKGNIIVIDHVPAEVCQLCGDVLLKPQTVRQIETLLRTLPQPKQTVPLYEFAAASSG